MKTALEFIKEIDEEGQEWSEDTEVLARYFDDYAKLYHEDKTSWISVEERLPEVDNKDNPFGERIDCLVVYEGFVYKGQYMNIGEPFWSVSHICSSSSLNVTKWMLLPKP